MTRENSGYRDDRGMQSRYGNADRRGGDYDDRDRGYYGDDRHRDNRYDRGSSREHGHDRYPIQDEGERRHHRSKEERRKEKKKSKGDKKYGSLFKSTKTDKEDTKTKHEKDNGNKDVPFEESNEYWNAERAKLGLKPLKD